MPYSPAQHRLFEARAHGASYPMAAKIPVATAKKMAGEGLKGKGQHLAHALKRNTGGMAPGSAGGIGGI